MTHHPAPSHRPGPGHHHAHPEGGTRHDEHGHAHGHHHGHGGDTAHARLLELEATTFAPALEEVLDRAATALGP
ncbi:hypothetical protein HW445_22235, partial [Streptomyces sp. UH6]|nr:hypothetical protein [Streptomyces sp. UH6]